LNACPDTAALEELFPANDHALRRVRLLTRLRNRLKAAGRGLGGVAGHDRERALGSPREAHSLEDVNGMTMNDPRICVCLRGNSYIASVPKH
jgi:hypothetical protein